MCFVWVAAVFTYWLEKQGNMVIQEVREAEASARTPSNPFPLTGVTQSRGGFTHMTLTVHDQDLH